MSLFPTDVLRRVLDPRTGQSTEASPVPLEQSPELAPNGKGFIVIPHPFDAADPTRYLGTLPDGLSAQALDVSLDNPSLMDYAIWKPKEKKLHIETYNFAKNPKAKIDVKAKEEGLRDSGYSVSSRTYPERIILISAKKADPNPAPRATEAEELEFV